jgi:hypothetical protein
MPLSDVATNRLPVSGHEGDSFATCVQAAMTRWGRTVCYARVAGLSGAAFSPPWSRQGHCPAARTERGSDMRVEFLGHVLGFTVELLCDASVSGRTASTALKKRARDAVREGAVVLCRRRRHWRAVEEQNTHTGTPVYALRPAERTLTRREAMQEALRFGAAVAAGPFAAGPVTYGGRVYDAWLARLDQRHFCPVCRPNGWRCAEQVAGRALSTQLAAAEFLSRASACLGPMCDEKSTHQAAAAYVAMARKLAPYAPGGGLREVWSDSLGRERYVQDVEQVRNLHRMAASHLARLACVL